MKKSTVLGLVFAISVVFLSPAQCAGPAERSAAQQESSPDSVFFSFLYMESGDVYVGRIAAQSDTALLIVEKNLGRIRVHPGEVKRTEHIFRHSLVRLSLSDHSKYTGRLLDVEETDYVLETPHTGVLRLPKVRVTEIVGIEEERRVIHNPNSTRYFFAPSAIPIEKNGGYYQNAYLLSNSVNFGLSPNFTLGGGVVIPMLFYITPKVGFRVRPDFYMGAGLLAATTLIPDAIVSGGIPFVLATIGNMEDNFTIGSGYGLMWSEGDFEHTHYPITTLNGMLRISNRLHLVSENWIIPFKRHKIEEGYFDDYGNWVDDVELDEMENKLYMALSFGVRIRVGERGTVDFAPVYLLGDSGVIIPYLDFVYKF